MNILAWILQVLIAGSFLLSAGFRLITPYETLITMEGVEWANDLSAVQVKIIAVLEILGAIGLILPMFIKRFRFLVPTAALGLALTMVGASYLHICRGEPIIVNAVLFALTLTIAFLRRGYFSRQG
ncbi:MAG: DoxX family protein [Marinoscillum sp.]